MCREIATKSAEAIEGQPSIAPSLAHKGCGRSFPPDGPPEDLQTTDTAAIWPNGSVMLGVTGREHRRVHGRRVGGRGVAERTVYFAKITRSACSRIS